MGILTYLKLGGIVVVLAGVVALGWKIFALGGELSTLRINTVTLKAELANRVNCLEKIKQYQADRAVTEARLDKAEKASAEWFKERKEFMTQLNKLRNEAHPASPVIPTGTPCDDAVKITREWEAINVH